MIRRSFVIGGSAPPAFSPLDISSLDLWYRADLGITIATGVSNWANQGYKGSAQNLVQAVGSQQPTYNAADADFNNQASLSYASASSTLMSCPGYTFGSTAGEVWFIAKKTADPSASGLSSGGPFFVAGPSSITNYPWTDGTLYEGMLRTAFIGSVNPTPNLTSTHCYSVLSDGVVYQNFLNGSLLTSTTPGTFAFPTGAEVIVSGNSRGSYRYDGKLAEVLVFSAALTSGQRSNLKAYLASRYAITIV